MPTSAIDRILAYYSSPTFLNKVGQTIQAQFSANPNSIQTIGGISFEIDADGNPIAAQSQLVSALYEDASQRQSQAIGSVGNDVIRLSELQTAISPIPPLGSPNSGNGNDGDSVLEINNGSSLAISSSPTVTGTTKLDSIIQSQNTGDITQNRPSSQVSFEDLTTQDFLSLAAQETGYGIELSEETQEQIITLASTEKTAQQQRQQGFVNLAGADTQRILTSLNPFADVRFRQQNPLAAFSSSEPQGLDVDISTDLNQGGQAGTGAGLAEMTAGFENGPQGESEDPNRGSQRQRRYQEANALSLADS